MGMDAQFYILLMIYMFTYVFNKRFNYLFTEIHQFSRCSRTIILTPNQFGFQNEKFTTNAVFSLVIIESFNEENCAVSLLFDFTKAVDLVNLDMLLSKMSIMGICGLVLEQFRQFLKNRCQMVKVSYFYKGEIIKPV